MRKFIEPSPEALLIAQTIYGRVSSIKGGKGGNAWWPSWDSMPFDIRQHYIDLGVGVEEALKANALLTSKL